MDTSKYTATTKTILTWFAKEFQSNTYISIDKATLAKLLNVSESSVARCYRTIQEDKIFSIKPYQNSNIMSLQPIPPETSSVHVKFYL